MQAQRKGHHPTRFVASLSLAFAAALAAATISCQDSKMTTSPNGTASPASAQVAGTWSGSFQAYDSSRCAGSAPATASFQQVGTTLTGTIKTSDCGVAGAFRGAVDGNTIMGWIDMTGCTGGGVSGSIDGSRITLSIADLTKPLVTGDQVVMAGGSVSLHR